MNADCKSCRRALWRALEGFPNTERLFELSVNRHVLTCSECRELLEREHALEMLLAHMPDVPLPPDLVGRLIARLRASLGESEGDPLDQLLEQVGGPVVPSGLGASLASAVRERHLDEQLDVALERVPAPEVPANLAGTLLSSLESERTVVADVAPVAAGPASSGAASSWLRSRVFWSAAAALIVTLCGVWLLKREERRPFSSPEELISAIRAGDVELLEYLDVLENWDLLVADELDILLSSADPLDELLLDFELELLDQEARTDASHG